MHSDAFCFASLGPSAAKVRICGEQRAGELASLPWFEEVSWLHQCLIVCLYLGGQGGMNALLRQSTWTRLMSNCHPLCHDWLQ